MKKILVPCDFSTTSQQAYTFALDIAKKMNAEVFVMKAIDFPFMYESSFAAVPYSFDPGSLLKELEEDAKKSFKKMKGSYTRQEDVSFEVIQGPVTAVIRNFIDSHKIDLVVMGTNGAGGLAEYLVGSNTEKIVRFSPVPVFVVRKAINLSSIKNIVFPTTLELDQVDLIAKVKELQSLFDATLHLLLVNTPHYLKPSKGELDQMEQYASYYKLRNYTLSIRDDFREQEGIMLFAQEIKADMIAMATHGRRGLAHLFMGSITEDVVNHGACPIWTCSIRKREELHPERLQEEAMLG
jgi:nucleotide-binding universal stress UspA family protein